MERLLPLALALLLLGCSSASDEAAIPAATVEPIESVEPVENPTEEFCSTGNGFVTDTRTRLIATPDAATFVDIDARLLDLVQEAPSDVTGAIESLRTGFAAIGEAYAATGFDPGATLSLDPEVQDTTALAGSTLRSYLLANCDLAGTRDVQIAQIREAFGIDDSATAECIHTQLGDVANIESSTLTPELMTAPVCGTSILGLLSGETSSGS